MPQINMPSKRTSPLERIGDALQIVHAYYGIKGAKQTSDMFAEQADPASDYSKVRQSATSSLIKYLSDNKFLDKKDSEDLLGTPDKPGLISKQSGTSLDKYVETNAPLKLALARLSAIGMGNRYNSLNDTKIILQQNAIHQQVLNKIQKDPTVAKQLVQYQNLDNALNNYLSAEYKTPQAFDELQQAVRANLGIKGNSVGDERERTYMKGLGIDIKRIEQILTTSPQDIGANNELANHMINLVKLEQKNVTSQSKRRFSLLAGGNSWLYEQRPDLKMGLDEVLEAAGRQFQSGVPSGGEEQQGESGIAGLGQVNASSPSNDFQSAAEAELKRRKSMRQQQQQVIPRTGNSGEYNQQLIRMR